MGHFAKVINGLVVEVNVATQEWVDAQPKVWYIDWVQTSYNMRGGVYYDSATNQPAADQSVIEKKWVEREKIMQGLAIVTTANEMHLYHRHRTQVGHSMRTHVCGKHRFLTRKITSNTYGTKHNKNGHILAIITKMAS
jgi:hypothetical protein